MLLHVQPSSNTLDERSFVLHKQAQENEPILPCELSTQNSLEQYAHGEKYTGSVLVSNLQGIDISKCVHCEQKQGWLFFTKQ